MTNRVDIARRLRRDLTDAERVLWTRLRRNALGFHFKRQVPLGPYIADFVSQAAHLVVEIDGGQHGGPEDQRRDADLLARGYRTLRFWNNDMLRNTDGVVTVIQQALGAPPPYPPPQAGEGISDSDIS